MLIDFHTHAFPDALASRAIQSLSKASGNLPHCTDGTESGLSEACRRAGVDRWVVLPIAVKPHQMRTINDTALALRGGPSIRFGSIHPLASDALYEIDRLAELGFPGVKLHPEYQRFNVDDPACFPAYERLAKHHMIVTFHAGYDLGFGTPPRCAPAALAKALPVLSGAVTVAAHMGGMGDWLAVQEHLCGRPELYFDTGFSFTHIPPQAAKDIIHSHGADHILFGSDCPWGDIGAEANFISSLELTSQEEALIFHQNAKRLLSI